MRTRRVIISSSATNFFNGAKSATPPSTHPSPSPLSLTPAPPNRSIQDDNVLRTTLPPLPPRYLPSPPSHPCPSISFRPLHIPFPSPPTPTKPRSLFLFLHFQNTSRNIPKRNNSTWGTTSCCGSAASVEISRGRLITGTRWLMGT